MHLKIFIDSNDQSLKTKYIDYIYQREAKMIKDPEHIDAGFDIFVPHDVELNNRLVNKIDFMISCSAQIVKRVDKEYNCIETHNTGYYMYPRSSISKTHLRLANNVGIIDAGYRGHLMGMFDVLYHDHDLLTVNKFDRLLQICAPELIPIYVELVDSKDKLGGKTIRGDGGFGSTGV
jgi:dUTP pyrophosphatase